MTENQLGSFINYNIWKDAISLLEFQISQRQTNKHFNTISMKYYNQLDRQERENISTEDYFTGKISNDLFYGLSQEFSITPYFQPKQGLSLRNYTFLSYPMRCVYYAITLYISKLTSSFIRKLSENTNQNIVSLYGGNLLYAGEELKLRSDSVYYRSHYKKFEKTLFQQLGDDFKDSVCLRIDISNYFDSISIPLFLNRLDDLVLATRH
jgi:hypothetical protein